MTSSKLSLIAGCLAAAVVCGLPTCQAGEPEGPGTYVRFLAGQPHTVINAPEVAVYPGTVVLPGEDAAKKAQGFQKVVDELKETYRLAEVRPERWQLLRPEAGKPSRLEGLEGAPQVELTLLSSDARQATYRVRMSEGPKTLAEPTITVRRGGRAIVGARDGARAPYLFLLIEPLAEPSQKALAQEPKKIHHVLPVYPPQAKKAGVDGVVLLSCHVGRDGVVKKVDVLHGEPMGLTEAAVAAASGWRYEPPRDAAGQVTDAWLTVTIAFRLQ